LRSVFCVIDTVSEKIAQKTDRKYIQITKQVNLQLQKEFLTEIPITILDTKPDTMIRQMQVQIQAPVQMQKTQLITKQISTVFEVTPPIITISFPLIFPLPIPKKIQEILQPPAYDVFVKKRQYVSGEKVYPTEFEQVGNQLTKHDALSLGASIVGSNAKATFRIKPTEGKPKKLRKKISSWWTVHHQFHQKSKTTYVEKTMYRINSPGELEEITQKGIEAQRRKGPTPFTDYPKTDKKTSKILKADTFVNIDALVGREVNRLINKSWRI